MAEEVTGDDPGGQWLTEPRLPHGGLVESKEPGQKPDGGQRPPAETGPQDGFGHQRSSFMVAKSSPINGCALPPGTCWAERDTPMFNRRSNEVRSWSSI